MAVYILFWICIALKSSNNIGTLHSRMSKMLLRLKIPAFEGRLRAILHVLNTSSFTSSKIWWSFAHISGSRSSCSGSGCSCSGSGCSCSSCSCSGFSWSCCSCSGCSCLDRSCVGFLYLGRRFFCSGSLYPKIPGFSIYLDSISNSVLWTLTMLKLDWIRVSLLCKTGLAEWSGLCSGYASLPRGTCPFILKGNDLVLVGLMGVASSTYLSISSGYTCKASRICFDKNWRNHFSIQGLEPYLITCLRVIFYLIGFAGV